MDVPNREHYDQLYKEDYMSGFTDIYEYCRLKTVLMTLCYLKKTFTPQTILDVGCGQGRYLGIVRQFYENSMLAGIDISEVAISKAREKFPESIFYISSAEKMDCIPDASIDFIITIELLEHVQDVRKTVSEFSRVLKPNGRILFTTPCANRYSFEWFSNFFSQTLEKSPDGFNRFGTDPYEHVRRLTSDDISQVFSEVNLSVEKIRFRAHFFTRLSYLIYTTLRKKYNKPVLFKFFAELAFIDWRLFRWLPNGATMIGIGKKYDRYVK